MKGILGGNLDLDVILSKEEAEGIRLQSKITPNNFRGFHIDYTWPLILGNVENENGEVVGTVRLQQGIERNLLQEIPDARIDRGVFIREEGPHWFLQVVTDEAYKELRDGNLTRRLPHHQSQLWVYIRDE